MEDKCKYNSISNKINYFYIFSRKISGESTGKDSGLSDIETSNNKQSSRQLNVYR